MVTKKNTSKTRMAVSVLKQKFQKNAIYWEKKTNWKRTLFIGRKTQYAKERYLLEQNYNLQKNAIYWKKNTICKRTLFIRTKLQSAKERYLLEQKHNLQIIGVIPFIKLQNDT